MEQQQEVNAFVHFCGLLAPIAGFVVFLSPWPTIRRIQVEQKTGSLPLLPYSSMVISTLIWTAYGFLQHEPRIWLCNGAGFVLGTYYYWNFIQYCPKLSRSLPGTITQHHYAIAGTVVFLCLLMLVLTEPAKVIGNLGVVFTVIMFASPLAALRVVLETKSARSIPLPFTAASILNCFLWTVFGWWQANDPNLYIPNILGLLFALLQLALKLHFDPTALQNLGQLTNTTPEDDSSSSDAPPPRKPIVMV